MTDGSDGGCGCEGDSRSGERDGSADERLYPNRGRERSGRAVSRRRLLSGSAAAGAALTAGCSGGSDDSGADGSDTTTDGDGSDATPDGPVERDSVFVFNTGDGTVSVIDTATDEVAGTRHLGLTASFPSNQYAPRLTAAAGDALWLNVGRGVRALAAGTFAELARQGTGSGANWQERTPDGAHLVVSARDGSHTQYRIDADTDSSGFGSVTGEIDRTDEGGRGDNAGPGPCDVTVHPDGEYAYVPDLYGDTLTVLSVDPFGIETQVPVDPVVADAAAPWMGTASWDGDHLLVEHNEGAGTESVWDTSDPAAPGLVARVTADDGLGGGPLTSEIGPDSETGYVFTPDTDDVTVLDHASGEIIERIEVGARPYGATAATVRPAFADAGTSQPLVSSLARVGVDVSPAETSYCIGECACGHELDQA